MVIIESRGREGIINIVKQGNSKLPDYSKAKSMRGFLQGMQLRFARGDSPESVQARLIINTLNDAYNHFHPKLNGEIEVPTWKGKSSFEVIIELDKWVVVRFQRPAKGEEPVEVRVEIPIVEVNSMGKVINSMMVQEKLSSKEVLEMFYKVMGWDWVSWNHSIFTNRSLHNRLTKLLGAFDSLGLIEYKGGKVLKLK